MANNPSVKLNFDMERLADNFAVVESVVCIGCKKIHERSENTYITVYGNICVGEVGGILGGGNWSESGVPVNTFCKSCLVEFIRTEGKGNVRI